MSLTTPDGDTLTYDYHTV